MSKVTNSVNYIIFIIVIYEKKNVNFLNECSYVVVWYIKVKRNDFSGIMLPKCNGAINLSANIKSRTFISECYLYLRML